MINKTVAIILHEHDHLRMLSKYMINHYAECWRRDGLRVEYLFGVKKFIPADLAILHVDLSVVPDPYLKFVRRYPKVLNGRVKDIRKSCFSRIILKKNDNYCGKVIVKTDLNAYGRPEWKKRSRGQMRVDRWRLRLGLKEKLIKPVRNYPIYDRLADVPETDFADPALIVEKFIPEIEAGCFCVRTCLFFGDQVSTFRLKAKTPLVKAGNAIEISEIEPHSEVINRAEELNFDFGKFDYVVHENRATIFDINKTPGCGPSSFAESTAIQATRRQRARGIFAYFD